MTDIKRKLKVIKYKFQHKYGMTLPLVGALTLGTVSQGLLQKYNDKNQTETFVNDMHRDMTEKEKCDALLMSMLIMTEGCSLDAYIDDVGIWTYGIGSTKTIDGKSVKKGDTLKDFKEAYEVADLHVEKRIDYVFDYIKRDLTPNQKAALKSFAYNCGAGTLVNQNGELTKLGKAVNEGNDDFVIREMLTYNKGKKRFMTGLFFRRVLEAYVYQEFISTEELQKCIIGGIYNVSYNQEMRDIFSLKTVKLKNKKIITKATYSDKAITNPDVAQKLLDICQTPPKNKIADKYAKMHMGEKIAEFLPKNLDPNTPILNENIFADVNQQNPCMTSSLKINDKKEVASITPDLRALFQRVKNIRGK